MKNEQKSILNWYNENSRALPWRESQNPYFIMVSEFMLQQTTTQTVIPYYINFIRKFPHIKDLSRASEKEVLAQWAGLGYYQRARQLHKSSQILAHTTFPTTYQELIKLPGFGPYTSRAISSLAFNENVGVIDGNTIRVLSRFYALKIPWWNSKGHSYFQNLVDEWVQNVSSSKMNQALMDLGAMVCKPSSPLCLLCPLLKECLAYKNNNVNEFPLKKMKAKQNLWSWNPVINVHKSSIALIKQCDEPFLKNQYLLPGKFKKITHTPAQFDYSHTITNNKIFVTLKKMKSPLNSTKNWTWVPISKLQHYAPSSLVAKAIQLSHRPKPKDDRNYQHDIPKKV